MGFVSEFQAKTAFSHYRNVMTIRLFQSDISCHQIRSLFGSLSSNDLGLIIVTFHPVRYLLTLLFLYFLSLIWLSLFYDPKYNIFGGSKLFLRTQIILYTFSVFRCTRPLWFRISPFYFFSLLLFVELIPSGRRISPLESDA